MKKKIFFLFTFFIIIFIIFLALRNEINVKKIFEKLEKETGVKIELKNQEIWKFFPVFKYTNNIAIEYLDNDFGLEDGNITLSRSYWPFAPIIFTLSASEYQIKGIKINELFLDAQYYDSELLLNNFFSRGFEGEIEIKGNIKTSYDQNSSISGNYKNVNLNMLLKQAKIADWGRVNIKLSSPNFIFNSSGKKNKSLIGNLNGQMDIKGSIYFISSEEERFGAALLSLLSEKINEMIPVSKSVSYLLNKYADSPSLISGKMFLNNGIISTEKLMIKNNNAYAYIDAKFNLSTNNINGLINFYEKDKLFIKAKLQGPIENPEILVGGKIFSEKENDEPKNIKKIFEEGIQSLVDKILTNN